MFFFSDHLAIVITITVYLQVAAKARFRRVQILRATLPKILISNFRPEIDFSHNSSTNFT